jgi:hypothetical protein
MKKTLVRQCEMMACSASKTRLSSESDILRCKLTTVSLQPFTQLKLGSLAPAHCSELYLQLSNSPRVPELSHQ